MAQFLGFGDGHDGAVPATGTVNSYAAVTGTAGSQTVTTDLTVFVGDIVLLCQVQGTGVTNWELVVVISAGSGQFTAYANLINTYASGAQAILIPQYKGGEVSATWIPTAWAGSVGGAIVACVSGKLLVSGGLNVAGKGFRGGSASSGNNASTPVIGYCGEGTVGALAQQGTANGNGGGAGNNNRGPYGGTGSQSGGGGGNGVAGTTGTGEATGTGIGGGTVGGADLTTMALGGGGGAGGCDWPPGNTGGVGGIGGGIIILFARELEITGSITADGGVGGDGSGANENDGGGGGGGGSILIKTQSGVLGTNKISASGGAGGTGGSAGGSENGGAGGNGRIRIESCSYTGSVSSPAPSYSTGGHDWCGAVAAILGG